MAITLTMPNQNGISDSLIVTSYNSSSISSTIIDQDIAQFTVTVANLVADDYNAYSLTNNVALGVGTTTFSYRIKTTVALDGSLKMTFRGLSLNAGATCSRRIVSGSIVTLVPYTQTVTGNSITVTLTASTITAGTTGEIVCSNLINLPSVST